MDYPSRLPLNDTKIFSENIILKLSNSSEISAYYHTLNRRPDDDKLLMHSHNFFELNFITSGNGIHYLSENVLPVKPGDFFIIPPHVLHGYYSDERFRIFHILLSNEFVFKNSEIFQSQTGYYSLFGIEPVLRRHLEQTLFTCTDEKFFVYLKQIADRLNDLCLQKTKPLSIVISNLVVTFILELEAYISPLSQNSILISKKYSDILKIMKYFLKHFSENINLQETANYYCMSYSTFQRKFFYVNGVTPSAFLIDCRLNHACNLLLYTNSSITEIAQNCGFYDAAHLTNSFVKRKRITPLKYRQLNLNNSIDENGINN